jgi:hypothetical protein
MKLTRIFVPIVASVLLYSCASNNLSYEGKAFKSAYESIKADELKKNLMVIASDEMEGRQTGSEGQKKAGVYMIDYYKNLGVSLKALGNGTQRSFFPGCNIFIWHLSKSISSILTLTNSLTLIPVWKEAITTGTFSLTSTLEK